jgi:hypothetical protein
MLRIIFGSEIKDVEDTPMVFCPSFSVIWTVKSVRDNGTMQFTTSEI